MRNNHFAKLVKYMRDIFSIDKGLIQLKDTRVNPKYKTGQVILPLLLGLLLRIKSMNELKYLLQENEFVNVIKRGTELPQIDTIRDTLKGALSLQNSKTPYFKGAPSYSEKCIKFRMTASLQDCHYLC